MDGALVGLFLLATFVGGIVTGLAGFAFGLVVTGVYLHILTPLETASLIVCFGMVIQSYGIWRLRNAINWRIVAPFVLGSTVGIPVGVGLLAYLNAGYLRLAVGIMLIVYSLHGLLRPVVKPVVSSFAADTAVGVFNGVLGGLTGLPGVIITIWCAMRGWPKDVQRSVFQPVLLASFILTLATLGISGTFPVSILPLLAIGVPTLLGGMWVGLKLYGRLDDAGFRKVILVLLLISGLVLTAPAFIWSIR